MAYRSRYERRLIRYRFWRAAAAVAVVLVVALWLDRPLYRAIAVTAAPGAHAVDEAGTSAARKAELERQDWVQMFRAAGYLPTWLLIGGGIWVHERWRGKIQSGGAAIIVGAIVSGLIAELLKLVFGRHRPTLDGTLHWNPFLGAVWNPEAYGHALGLPSSHVAVAFGAAFVVARVYPHAGWFALIAASGCALTRLLAGAHVLSDVLVAVLIAWACSALVGRATRLGHPRRRIRFD